MNESSATGAYTRGWESATHWVRTFSSSLVRQIAIGSLLGFFLAFGSIRGELSTRARGHLRDYIAASVVADLWPAHVIHPSIDGQRRPLPAAKAVEVLRPIFGDRSLSFMLRQLYLRAFVVVAFTAPLLVTMMVYFGRRLSADRHRRGAKRIDSTTWFYRHRAQVQFALITGAGGLSATALALCCTFRSSVLTAVPGLTMAALAAYNETLAAVTSPNWDGAVVWCSAPVARLLAPAQCYAMMSQHYGIGLGGLALLSLGAALLGAYLVGFVAYRRARAGAGARSRSSSGDLELAGIPIARKREVYHVLVAGATGAGKSVAIGQLLHQIRNRGQRVILLDTSGEYVARFYRPGIDVILNPFDARSARWTPWADIRKPADRLTLGESLFPRGANQKDEFWSISGSSVFAGLLERLDEWDAKRNTHLAYLAERLGPKELMDVLKGTVGERFVDAGAETTATNVCMTTAAHLRSFRFLLDPSPSVEGKHAGAAEGFSIRRFVEEPSDSWLFLVMREEDHSVLRPLISLWLDIAITAVLSLPGEEESLPHEQRRRLFVSLDELQALQKLPALEGALLRGRKKGLSVVLGIQSIKGVRAAYGRDEADALLGQPQTQLILRTPEEGTAQWLEAQLGKAEIERRSESQQIGSERGGMSVQHSVTHEAVVLASEIQDLPDLRGFLKTVGRPVTEVAYVPTTIQNAQPGFVAGPLAQEPQPPSYLKAKQALEEAESALFARERTMAQSALERAMATAPAQAEPLLKKIAEIKQSITKMTEKLPGGH